MKLLVNQLGLILVTITDEEDFSLEETEDTTMIDEEDVDVYSVMGVDGSMLEEFFYYDEAAKFHRACSYSAGIYATY